VQSERTRLIGCYQSDIFDQTGGEARAVSRLKNVIAREAAAATAPQWSSISPLEGEIAT